MQETEQSSFCLASQRSPGVADLALSENWAQEGMGTTARGVDVIITRLTDPKISSLKLQTLCLCPCLLGWRLSRTVREVWLGETAENSCHWWLVWWTSSWGGSAAQSDFVVKVYDPKLPNSEDTLDAWVDWFTRPIKTCNLDKEFEQAEFSYRVIGRFAGDGPMGCLGCPLGFWPSWPHWCVLW